MRKLPIYILVDSSESMIGEKLVSVQKDLEFMISSFRRDPYFLETTFISVISFNAKASVVTPLTECSKFKVPNIRIGSGSSLSAAFDLLDERLRLEVVKKSETQGGDWKPVVFLLASGVPSDDWKDACTRYFLNTQNLSEFFALIYGWDAYYDLSEKRIDPRFVRIENRIEGKGLMESALLYYFAKVNFSLSTSYDSNCWDFERSQFKEDCKGDSDDDFIDLPPPPPDVALIDSQSPLSKELNVQDDEQARNLAHNLTLFAVCATKGKELRVRFKLDEKTRLYTEGAVYPLPDERRDAKIDSNVPPVSSNLLCAYIPPCPYCGNDWLICGKCGSFYCDPIKPNSTSICPRCGTKGFVSYNGAAIDVVAEDSSGIAYGRLPYGGAEVDVGTSMG